MTNDELKAAAKRYAADDYWEPFNGEPVYRHRTKTIDEMALSAYAAAMLDETPATREEKEAAFGGPDGGIINPDGSVYRGAIGIYWMGQFNRLLSIIQENAVKEPNYGR